MSGKWSRNKNWNSRLFGKSSGLKIIDKGSYVKHPILEQVLIEIVNNNSFKENGKKIKFVDIAQLVEQWIENPRVIGSIPIICTK